MDAEFDKDTSGMHHPDVVPTRYWQRLRDGRLQCDLCPRECKLHAGQRGLCFVRGAAADGIVLTTYGRSSGFCIDPVEKKPLNHFYPGSAVLSFGTAGCNLACKFCQNWDISKARETDVLGARATPAALARAAANHGCGSVAFTYNDPVIFHEYALDVARACRDAGIHSIAVTAGYIKPAPRVEFFAAMDAANVDLKAFTADFYRRVCGGSLSSVLETLEYIVHETHTWLEITTLLIPGYNDSAAEITALSKWVARHLGCDVPLHFSAFHPDWKLTEPPRTPPATLSRARALARAEGLHYVYTGNVHDVEGGSTYCPRCAERVIQRDWYDIEDYRLDIAGGCPRCGLRVAGHFAAHAGSWGRKRQLIRIE